MGLDDYPEPKGAYYNPAIVASFPDADSAERAIEALRGAGLTQRDIAVARHAEDVTVIVSTPMPGMLEEARRLLQEGGATDVRPYGSSSDPV